MGMVRPCSSPASEGRQPRTPRHRACHVSVEVMNGRTQIEHKESASPQTADVERTWWQVREVPHPELMRRIKCGWPDGLAARSSAAQDA